MAEAERPPLYLICPGCGEEVPHYEGGTISDADDVFHVVEVSELKARDIPIQWRSGPPIANGTVPRRITRWMHGGCWRDPDTREGWALVVVTGG